MNIDVSTSNENRQRQLIILSLNTFHQIFVLNQSIYHQNATVYKESGIVFQYQNPNIQIINNSKQAMSIDYKTCKFEARLQKTHFLRKNDSYYLYVSSDKIIINTEPYAKKPWLVLQLLPTTHVKWLWQNKRNKTVQKNKLKGFIIETEGHMYQFNAQKIVLDELKQNFKKITLQSDFSDQYVLGKYIDKGNYAQVYECIRKDNGQKRAVKVLEKQRLKTMKNGKESVFNELKVLRSLEHNNLMRLFEVYEDRNKYYFILELLHGITLYKEIHNRRKKNPLKSHQIRSIVKQLLEGIKYLQEKGIMHRDIKPQNILFEQKDSLDKNAGIQGLKIVDYGLATFHNEKQIIFTKCGTPGFVAPQIITYDQKQAIYQLNVDTFSVGVIMHILLVGQQSFPGKSRNTILNKNKQCKLDYKSKKYEQIAGDGIDLLSKLLQKQPQKRITAAQALNHPFLIKDRPIFKFKKVYREQSEPENTEVPMKVYRNLEEIEYDQESPRKNRPTTATSTSSFNLKTNLISQYYEDLNYYEPFTYQHASQLDQNATKQAQPKQKRKIIFTILNRSRQNIIVNQNQSETYPEAASLFQYNFH